MRNETKTVNGKPTRTKVATYKYFCVHGRLPRGSGRWGFHPDFNVDSGCPEIFWTFGNFANAKRKAVAHFTGKAGYIDVLS